MFAFILLVVLWLCQIVLLDNIYMFVREKEVVTAISKIEENIDSDELELVLTDLADNHDIVVIPTEFSQSQSERLAFRNNEMIKPPPFMSIFGERPPEFITKNHTFVNKDGKTVALTIQAKLTPVNATINTLRYEFYFIAIFMVGISIVLAFVLAEKLSRPIVNINEKAKYLSKGNYSLKIEENSFLEVKELSETLSVASKELSKVEELRKELISNISHDLRTPLGLIYNYAEMMRDFPNEITDTELKVIVDESKRLSTLVDDLLDISQMESGTIKLNKTYFSLTKIIEETIFRVCKLVENEGYKIEFENDFDCIIYADPVKIQQVIYNLLNNAIHYTGEEKHIKILQKINHTSVVVEFIDTGVGIEAEYLPHIWERYYKVDKIHKRAVMGTGLGLSIVKNIMDMHEGKYGVNSEVGQGSCFWIEIDKIDRME